MPNQPKTPHRTIRVDDETWTAAQVKAQENDTTVSALVRGWLEGYVEDSATTNSE